MENQGDIFEQRKEKLEKIKKAGLEPYGRRFDKSLSIKELLENFKEDAAAKLAGRIVAIRLHGKSSFGNIKDQTGKIQFYMKEDVVGQDNFKLFVDAIDIGDIIGIEGKTFKTRTGEPTLVVDKFVILSKSLRPLPEKWHGLKDVETRYRQRYVDLIVNDDVRKIFEDRIKIANAIRAFLNERGFLEVETPMMHRIAGGAAGKPFKTHHDALNTDLYLRIAPELYLKKLLVGGFERVYEMNRSFRNEGISTRHNPEFTMLEIYQAYSDCQGMMKLTEELVAHVAKTVFNKMEFEYQGRKIDLSEWKRISFPEMMKNVYDITPEEETESWIKKLEAKGIKIEQRKNKLSRTQLLNIISDLVTPESGGHPVFVFDVFTELCPLAKKKKDNPLLSDRFELFMAGMEVANAYSELNDPIEQKQRFEEQAEMDKEAAVDEDFVRALEYGMPPAGGLGIGIDRLTMILTGAPSIRDVVLFPQLKPEEASTNKDQTTLEGQDE